MLLDKIKKMMGLGTLPDEVAPIYKGARSEKEALELLRDARRRDEDRRNRALEDVEILQSRESELMDEGRKEGDQNRRLSLARRIKDIRWKIEEIEARIESVFNKRIRIYKEHVASLETLVALAEEPLPSQKQLEEVAIKAKEKRDDLDRTVAMAEGMSLDKNTEPVIDAEERAILEEFQKSDEAKIEQAEADLPEFRPREKKRREEPAREPKAAERGDEEEELE
ncbi:MAG: hypothetical protein HUU15_10085 [Candidatus Brocadiae bacterium]|nr:hypothetical protein [Candidatus Brocadiia bacterium]